MIDPRLPSSFSIVSRWARGMRALERLERGERAVRVDPGDAGDELGEPLGGIRRQLGAARWDPHGDRGEVGRRPIHLNHLHQVHKQQQMQLLMDLMLWVVQ